MSDALWCEVLARLTRLELAAGLEGAAPRPGMPLSLALADVQAERAEQEARHGNPRDDALTGGELARAAACYATGLASLSGAGEVIWPVAWPWKPQGRRQNLVKAAALLVAEIERTDRAVEAAAARERARREG